ncbi:putative signal peptide peptidase [Phaeomoniella chlamydospora]|uniref:Putative signal peptide peptidase n=1 Tax=Phaeomoniella chlamydospora TaxID=158046 RepID=A0A0G2F2Q7_PHACM|nr:putative signal peptide peptidase [Phaeomoniella chlamydospora]
MSSTPGPVIRFLGRVAFELYRLKPMLLTEIHLLASAIFPIYIGAHASLSRPPSAAKPEKKKREACDDDDEDDEVITKMENLSASDAILLPVLAGVTLTSLYFVIKWLKDPALLNKILRYHFATTGLVFSTWFLKDVFSMGRSLLFPSYYVYRGVIWKLNKQNRQFEVSRSGSISASSRIRCSPLPGFLSRLHLPKSIFSRLWAFREFLYQKATLKFHYKSLLTIKKRVDILDIVAAIIASSLTLYSLLYSLPWYLTNFFGFTASYGTLQLMSPTTISTGTLILSTLFFYDIYMVFFTPMMITVATKIDIPVKLLFPRPPPEDSPPDTPSMALLGLGDIVIPGMMIGLALRFDLYMHYLRQQKPSAQADAEKPTVEKAKYEPATGQWGERYWSGATSIGFPSQLTATRFSKTYFKASVFGYIVGMIATLAAMQIFKHGQPALLYLVPGVVISLWGTAFVRGELKEMWEFTELEEDDDSRDNGDEKEKGKEEKTIENLTRETGIFTSLLSFFGLASKRHTDSHSKAEENASSTAIEDQADNETSITDQQTRNQAPTKSKKRNETSNPTSKKPSLEFSISLPKTPYQFSWPPSSSSSTNPPKEDNNFSATKPDPNPSNPSPTIANTTSASLTDEATPQDGERNLKRRKF